MTCPGDKWHHMKLLLVRYFAYESFGLLRTWRKKQYNKRKERKREATHIKGRKTRREVESGRYESKICGWRLASGWRMLENARRQKQSGNERLILMRDKAVEKNHTELQCVWRTHKKSQMQFDMCICGCFSPELGSQGSMSSSSLGHSAEATSRSSADCRRRIFRNIRNHQDIKKETSAMLHTPYVYFLQHQHITHPFPSLLQTPLPVTAPSNGRKPKLDQEEKNKWGGRR